MQTRAALIAAPKQNLAKTTMSFDVNDILSRSNASTWFPSAAQEAGPQSNSAASQKSLCVAVRSCDASLAARCGRADDNLLHETMDSDDNGDVDQTTGRAAMAYHAGAGGIIVGARELLSLSLSPQDPPNQLLETASTCRWCPLPSLEMTGAYLMVIVAQDPDSGMLQLAMSPASL